MDSTSKIRVKTVGQLGLVFPPTAQVLLNWAHARQPASMLSFAVPALPPSVNHIYLPGGGGRKRLSPEALLFRESVAEAIEGQVFKPRGVLLAIILYSSPYWITKERKIRPMDVDNRQKALIDAIALATGVNDMRLWEYHAYKVVARAVQTSVYVVDLGDIVEVFK